MKANMFVAMALLLVVSFTAFGGGYHPVACAKANPKKCKTTYITKKKVKVINKVKVVNNYITQIDYSPAIRALRKAQAVSQAKSTIPFRDDGLSIGIGAARAEGEDGFAVGVGYAKDKVKGILSVGDDGSISGGVSLKF